MPRAMTRYVFDKLQLSFSKTVHCTDCGRRFARRTTFSQTLNPWNLNDRGEPASRSEILDKIRAKGAEWQKQPERCTACLRKAAA